MRKFWSVLFIAILSSLLIACSGDDKEEAVEADKEEEESAEEESDVEDESDEEAVEADELDESDDADESDEMDDPMEETFADEITVLDVEKVLYNQDDVSDDVLVENEDVYIEHDDLVYVEHDFITEILDYEVRFDEENTLVEVFEDKGDYTYEPAHEDDEGALMDVGQIYVEEKDDYENIDGDEEELYQFIEYENKLYVPEQFVKVYLKAPLNYERRDQILEVGERSDKTSIYEVGITEDTSNNAEETQDSSDVTVEGKNHKEGIVLTDINSATKNADIDLDYNYSTIKGFIHNQSDEDTIEVKFQFEDEKTIDTVKIKAGKTEKFEYDVNGESVFKVLAGGEPGSSGKAIIIGDVK